MSQGEGLQKKLHIIVGTPDEDNCPICRAHAKGKFDQVIDEAFGPVLVQELSLHDMLHCSCPLCVRAREEEVED